MALAAAAILAAAPGSAQGVRLVHNTEWSENGSSEVQDFVTAGDLSYLVASDNIHGKEVWRTDGTTAGSFILDDLCPGPCDARDFAPVASSMVELDGELFFTASGTISQGLWTSDGTSPPVRLVNGRVFSLIVLDDILIFERLDAGNQATLWASDGTPAGTRRISFASPFLMVDAGDRAFFNTSSSRLWTSDGTDVGTHLVQDLGPSVKIRQLTALGERALIQAEDGLWSSNGVGAQKILTLPSGQSFAAFPRLPTTSDLAFFTTRDQGTGETRLWRSDGTAAGTANLGPLCAGSCVLGDDIAWLTTSERLIMLIPRPDETWELWASDGTAAGTLLLRTLQWTGQAELAWFRMTGFGERIVYADYAPDVSDVELWTSDGTPAGTRTFASFSRPQHGIRSLAMLAGDDQLWFALTVQPSPDEPAVELWQSDADLADAQLSQTLSGRFERLVGLARGQLYFTFDDGEHGVEPWVTSGGEAGARLLVDIVLQQGGLAPDSDLLATRRGVYFSIFRDFQFALWQSDGTAAGTMAPAQLGGGKVVGVIPFGESVLLFTDQDELWLSDGSAAGSVLLTDQAPASSEWAVLGAARYFLARQDKETTLWRTDGTPAGTETIITIDGSTSAYSRGLLRVGNNLVFDAPDGASPGLWRSNGTTAGTQFLALPIQPAQLMPVGNKVYFTNVGAPTELWESNGTAAGTRRALTFADVFAGTVQVLMHSDDALFFVVRDPNAQISLWHSNGTPAGTQRLGRLPSHLRTTFHPDGFVPLGDAVLFAVEDNAGLELWRADGTGARRLVDICPGECPSSPQGARVIVDRVYFAASDGASGLEPWTSDGTAAGTFRLADVNPGPQSSNPGGFAGYAGEIYFHAHHEALGTELWAYDLLGACPQSPGLACLNGGRFAVNVDWRSQHGDGGQGIGRQLPFSDQSRLFWFFNPENVELVVKLLDGRPINGAFWLFYGGLSDVEYWIDTYDRLTGRTVSFHNPPGQICGASNIHAFPEVMTPLTAPSHFMKDAASALELDLAEPQPQASGSCQSGATTLCLRDGRFQVEVQWRDRQSGQLKPGRVLPGTSESGYFWFFNAQNLELIVKVLDGRMINGKFWVFYGALSDVEYSLTVTDLMTGVSKTYQNPSGEICGVGDTLAFDG